MPQAFRSAAKIEAEAAQTKINRLRERWASTRDSWFDGTAESVVQRLAWLDEAEAVARSAASRLYASKVGADAMGLLPHLRADRNAIRAHLDSITGASWVPEEVDSSHFNIDPRLYPSREDWMDASNLSGYIGEQQHQHPAGDFPVPEHVQRLTQAAQEFVADQNTNDRDELVIRAKRFMEDRTASWEPDAARSTVREFVSAVADAAPRAQRVASRPVVDSFDDFDDHLMFA